jgi:hypothetical protein
MPPVHWRAHFRAQRPRHAFRVCHRQPAGAHFNPGIQRRIDAAALEGNSPARGDKRAPRTARRHVIEPFLMLKKRLESLLRRGK